MKTVQTGLQAIRTKYLGPTNRRGSRIQARAAAGTVTLSWDHALTSGGNHRAAALALCDRFGWDSCLVSGGFEDGSEVWVQIGQHLPVKLVDDRPQQVPWMSRDELADELAAAGEYTADWETADIEDLRQRVKLLISS